MADKSTQLVLEALSRAAAAPAGAPLHGSKTAPGLFPTNAAGKQAAQRCQEDGYLRLLTVEEEPTVAGGTATRLKKKGSSPPLGAITEKGLAHLLDHISPRPILEDFLRALDGQRQQTEELLRTGRQMQQSIEALRGNAEKVLQRIRPPEATERGHLNGLFAAFLNEADSCNNKQSVPSVDSVNSALPHEALLAELSHWPSAGAQEDCPLPHLFRQLPPRTSGWSIGQFHDALRQLHDLGKIYLHPWTGPLYEIPEPPYALLIGHEIAYYASIRK